MKLAHVFDRLGRAFVSAAALSFGLAVGSAHALTSTTTTLSSSVNPAYVGQNTVLTASVSPSAASGTVTFKDGSTTLGTGTLSGGVATLTKSFTTTGSHTLTAVYGGNTTYATSTSAAKTQTVNAKTTTTTTLTSSVNPSYVGQSTTLTATVTGTSPSGTVTFKDGTTTLGTGTLSGGVATYVGSFTTTGSHSLTAVYAGDTANNGSTSSAKTQTVNAKTTTTTTLTSSINPSYVGQSTTLTATVTGTSPSGTVTFKDGTTTLGTGTLSGGVASFAGSFSATGAHSLTAVYAGDTANAGSTSSAVSQTVNAKAGSVTVLTSSINPSAIGQTTTLTATVTGSSPSGTVTFKDGATTLGTGTITAGVASLARSFSSVGVHSLTADYAGDGANMASSSGAVSQTVTVAVSQTVLSANPTSVAMGASVNLMATVTGSAPSGTVTFSDGSSSLGSANLVGGAASLSAAFTSAGTHVITARYAGDGNNGASVSSAVNVNVTASSLPATPPSSPAPIVNYEYDANANPTKVIQAPGESGFNFTSSKAYDALNRAATATDARSGLTQFGYNGRDALTQVTDPRSLVTQYGRNGLGDTTQVTSPDTGSASQTYDAAGNLLTRTDSRGALASYTYDAINRPTLLLYTQSGQASLSFSWTYDQTGPGFSNGLGRLTSAGYPSGSSQYAYDAKGRLVVDTQRVTPASGANSALISTAVGYSYDTAGRLVSLQYPSGRVVSIAYDAAGRPSSLSLAATASGTPTPLITQIEWEPFGAARSWQWQLGGATLLHERLRDASGRMVRYHLGNNLRDVTYDAADRITGYTHYDATTTAATPNLDQRFGYDELGRLTGVSTGASNWSISYDANGNRTGLSLNGAAMSYTTSATSNRLTALSNPARNLGYDNAGNTTSDSGGAYAATYDASGKLATLTKAGVTTTYSYDGQGRRVRKYSSTGPASTVVFAYAQDGRLLGEYDNAGAAIREYVWLGSTPIALVVPDAVNAANPPSVYYIHADHIDTPRVITDTSGNLRWRWLSEPFGTAAPETNPSSLGAFTFPLRMPGQYADQESGLFYNMARSYDSGIGRYAQSDPIGLEGGINTYSYVDSRPIDKIDPTGLIKWSGTIYATGGSKRINPIGITVTAWGVTMELESECVNGKKMKVTLEDDRQLERVSGLGVEALFYRGKVSDFEDGKATLSPHSLSDLYRIHISGPGIGGAGRIANSSGGVGHIAIGGAFVIGSHTLVGNMRVSNPKTYDCPCETK